MLKYAKACNNILFNVKFQTQINKRCFCKTFSMSFASLESTLFLPRRHFTPFREFRTATLTAGLYHFP